MTDTKDRLYKQRARLILDQPFFGAMLLGLKWVREDSFQTMATDGVHLFWNGGFVDGLTDAQLRGVLCHEVMHIAQGTHIRQCGRDHRGWNVATDYAINRDLLADGFELPEGGLFDAKYAGMSAEAIFAAAPEAGQPKPQPPVGTPGTGQGQPGSGETQPSDTPADDDAPDDTAPEPADDGTPVEPEVTVDDVDPGGCGQVLPHPDGDDAAKAQMAQTVRQAVVAAEKAGKGGSNCVRAVKTSLEPPKVPWADVLRDFVSRATRQDYTWARPNRRHVHRGIHLPSWQVDTPQRVMAILDTSGSVDERMLDAFYAELQELLDTGAAASVRIACADTRIHCHGDYAQGEEIDLVPQGGGGTNFKQPMQWAADNLDGAVCLLYLTDMCTSSFGEDPGVPVLWLDWENSRWASAPDFGQVVAV
jgi:predicted metal-dependent peptidase